MSTRAQKLRQALEAFDRSGDFSEEDLAVLRTVLAAALRGGHDAQRVLDGLVGLFFERHVLDDTRRRELLALGDDELERAVRHRFRQVLADDHDARRPYHALRAHVRDALAAQGDRPPPEVGFPVAIQAHGAFDPLKVEGAVQALWREWHRKPQVHEATTELLQRYLNTRDDTSITRDFPEVVRARLDAQRLARGILEVLSAEEKDLLRHVLDGEGNVEAWAEARGISRATAYRLLSRLKALCRLEVSERSPGTKIEVLSALRDGLLPRT